MFMYNVHTLYNSDLTKRILVLLVYMGACRRISLCKWVIKVQIQPQAFFKESINNAPLMIVLSVIN